LNLQVIAIKKLVKNLFRYEISLEQPIKQDYSHIISCLWKNAESINISINLVILLFTNYNLLASISSKINNYDLLIGYYEG